MSNPTLSEIVSSALEQVGAETPTVKLASSSDVPPSESASSSEEEKKKKEEKKKEEEKSEEKVASTAEILEDSAYGLKLAASLEVAATIVQQKLAEGGVVPPAPGNAVATLEATNNVPVTLTPAPKGVVEKAVTSEAKIEAGPMPDSQPDHTGNPDWTNNKEAAEAHIQSKIAQAGLLEELGQHEAAAEMLGEAEKLAGRTSATIGGSATGSLGASVGGARGAYLGHGPDKSTTKKASLRQAVLTRKKLATADSSPLVIEGEITSSMLPDNAGAIAMTTAQAKSKSQAEASALLNQTPQKDPVVEAELEHTEVAKVSSLLQAVSIRGLG